MQHNRGVCNAPHNSLKNLNTECMYMGDANKDDCQHKMVHKRRGARCNKGKNARVDPRAVGWRMVVPPHRCCFVQFLEQHGSWRLFLERLIKDNETRGHHVSPNTGVDSMAWKHLLSLTLLPIQSSTASKGIDGDCVLECKRRAVCELQTAWANSQCNQILWNTGRSEESCLPKVTTAFVSEWQYSCMHTALTFVLTCLFRLSAFSTLLRCKVA